jgi:hypothetical protein
MKWGFAKNLKASVFKRIIGIKRETFEAMLVDLKEAEKKKRLKGGRRNKLSIEDRLLMALEYWREYRTYATIGLSYGLSESNVYQAIIWIEDTLKQLNKFALPGKKAIGESNHIFEVLLIDATETPIQRPKKSNQDIIPVRKSDIRLKHN